MSATRVTFRVNVGRSSSLANPAPTDALYRQRGLDITQASYIQTHFVPAGWIRLSLEAVKNQHASLDSLMAARSSFARKQAGMNSALANTILSRGRARSSESETIRFQPAPDGIPSIRGGETISLKRTSPQGPVPDSPTAIL